MLINRMSRQAIGLVSAFSLVPAVANVQGGKTLIINGKVASRDVRVINGRPYAPLADIARATSQTLARKGSGYELVAAGGANQVQGLRGKIGDTLFDGKWRFRVLSVQKVPTYTLRWEGGVDHGRTGGKVETPDARTIKAKPGSVLVVATCHVRNGQKATEAFGTYYGQNTALADTQGSSYAPIGFDQEGGLIHAKRLLPGAGQDLAAIFVVPENAQLKDLVFTLTNISDRNPKDVRIALAP